MTEYEPPNPPPTPSSFNPRKYAQTLQQAVTFVEQGHIRIGPEIVTDPAFLVTRTMEDFITWSNGSKIRRTIQRYNDQEDDFDLMNL